MLQRKVQLRGHRPVHVGQLLLERLEAWRLRAPLLLQPQVREDLNHSHQALTLHPVLDVLCGVRRRLREGYQLEQIVRLHHNASLLFLDHATVYDATLDHTSS